MQWRLRRGGLDNGGQWEIFTGTVKRIDKGGEIHELDSLLAKAAGLEAR